MTINNMDLALKQYDVMFSLDDAVSAIEYRAIQATFTMHRLCHSFVEIRWRMIKQEIGQQPGAEGNISAAIAWLFSSTYWNCEGLVVGMDGCNHFQ